MRGVTSSTQIVGQMECVFSVSVADCRNSRSTGVRVIGIDKRLA